MVDVFGTDQPRRNLDGALWAQHVARCQAADVCAWAMLREQLVNCEGRCVETCWMWPEADAPQLFVLRPGDTIAVTWAPRGP